jgi:hypothetical protein
MRRRQAMLYNEAYEKYGCGGIVYLLSYKGEQYTVSEVNNNGGVCDCCELIHGIDTCEVIKVVDVAGMNILYEKETQHSA